MRTLARSSVRRGGVASVLAVIVLTAGGCATDEPAPPDPNAGLFESSKSHFLRSVTNAAEQGELGLKAETAGQDCAKLLQTVRFTEGQRPTIEAACLGALAEVRRG